MLQIPGTMRTEDIIYPLPLTGLQREGDLENSKCPMVQGTPWPNIILHQAFTGLLGSPPDSGPRASPCPVGGSPCHPSQSSQVTSGPARKHTNVTGSSHVTAQETQTQLGARTSRRSVTQALPARGARAREGLTVDWESCYHGVIVASRSSSWRLRSTQSTARSDKLAGAQFIGKQFPAPFGHLSFPAVKEKLYIVSLWRLIRFFFFFF